LSIVALGAAVGVALGLEGVSEEHSTEAFAAAARAWGEPPIVDCRTRLQVQGRRRVDRGTRRISTVAGPLAFFGAKRRANARRGRLEPRPGRLKQLKVSVLLKAGRTVTVSLLAPPGRNAELWFGLDQAPHETGGQSVELRSCPIRSPGTGRRRGGYVFFPAAFKIDGPMCLRVTVEVEGRPAPISRRVAFGRHTCEPIVGTRSERTFAPTCAPPS
jgi:hypothetical protein